jgi:hypothetical protein
LDRFVKIAKASTFWGLRVAQLRVCILFDRKWVGQHLGRFLTDSSGRPGAGERRAAKESAAELC